MGKLGTHIPDDVGDTEPQDISTHGSAVLALVRWELGKQGCGNEMWREVLCNNTEEAAKVTQHKRRWQTSELD